MSGGKSVVFPNWAVGPITDASTLLVDGNTVGRYYFDASVTLVGDASVSVWADIYGSGNNLVRTAGATQPKWESDGILFDGVDDYIGASVAINQPITLYMVYKQIARTQNDVVLLLNSATGEPRIYQGTSDQSIVLTAGEYINNVYATVGNYAIISAVINGTNSNFQWNTNAAPGNAGTGNANGIRIGTDDFPVNMKVKELIVRNVADTSANQTLIYNYLATKYSNDINNILKNGTFDNSAGWDTTNTLIADGGVYFLGTVGQSDIISQASTNMVSPMKPSTSYVLMFDASFAAQPYPYIMNYSGVVNWLDPSTYVEIGNGRNTLNWTTPGDIDSFGINGLRISLAADVSLFMDNIVLYED